MKKKLICKTIQSAYVPKPYLLEPVKTNFIDVIFAVDLVTFCT